VDDQTLERLMIDDALGALAPDVSALLSDYTQRMGTVDQQRMRWRQLADAARAAMDAPAVEALPPFPAGQLRAARLWHTGRIGMAIAAVLLVGFGIGLWMPSQHAALAPLAQVSNPSSSSGPREEGVRDFWSSQRLVASAVEHTGRGHPAWRWTSPLTESPNSELQ
jgi:anti-sigma factor RsiW